jgi:hypothetical protein
LRWEGLPLRLFDLDFDNAQLGMDAGHCRGGALPGASQRALDQISVRVRSVNRFEDRALECLGR